MPIKLDMKKAFNLTTKQLAFSDVFTSGGARILIQGVKIFF
jgi:hypothetical protein